MTKSLHGADLIVKTFADLGVEVVFGIPGSHDAPVYEALRKSPVRTVLTTNELHAAFMANGYYRFSGKPGVMLAIAGPGFTNSITGLAEAFFDSAALVCVVCKPSDLPGTRYQLQKIEEEEIARSVTKNVFSVREVSAAVTTLRECFQLAAAGEPGPVLLEISTDVLSQKVTDTGSAHTWSSLSPAPLEELALENTIRRILTSRRLLLYLGQGTQSSSSRIAEAVDLLNAPVLTTTSGRGVLSEDHPLCLPCDLMEDVGLLNSVIDSCDLILALGCKFTHNGSKGFRLRFPEDRFIHVDASQEVLGANYPALLTLCGDAAVFLDSLLERKKLLLSRETGWKPGEVEGWRRSILKSKYKKTFPEPHFDGLRPPTAPAFFSMLEESLPENSCVVTDSGLHEMLARKYLRISSPRGLIVPADFQSMGFGIPSGIGAKLADPERTVAVLTGDGGFALSGMELLTAVRESVGMTVIVFNDRGLGLIRLHQLSRSGYSHAVRTGEIDYARFCEAAGISYFKGTDDTQEKLTKALNGSGVSLVEVVLKDSFDFKKAGAKGIFKSFLSDF